MGKDKYEMKDKGGNVIGEFRADRQDVSSIEEALEQKVWETDEMVVAQRVEDGDED